MSTPRTRRHYQSTPEARAAIQANAWFQQNQEPLYEALAATIDPATRQLVERARLRRVGLSACFTLN